MRLKHAIALAAALLPAACAPGLGGFDAYAGPPGAYAAPYPAAEPFYRPTPPLSPYGVGPGYGGYDRGRREWEQRREHEARDAYRRDRERQEFDRRRFEQTRREERFRHEQFRHEQFRREDMRRHEPRPDFSRSEPRPPAAPPQIVGPPPGRSLTPEQQHRAREDVRQMFGVR